MRYSWVKRIKIVQRMFRYRLFLIRQKKIAAVKKRSEDDKFEWLVHIAERNAWRKKCRPVTCNGCEQHITKCICRHSAEPEIIVAILRKIAKKTGLPRFVRNDDIRNSLKFVIRRDSTFS